MLTKPKIMGILNITPDSFSDGGKFIEPKLAIEHAKHLAQNGADIIDIGGESTRPNSKAISHNEELNRIKSIVSELTKSYFVSIDTFRSETARACLELGAKMINDVSALRHSAEMAKTIAEYKAEVILMYSKQDGASPHATKENKDYSDVIADIKNFLSKQIDYALEHGIETSKIILDPGMGTFISPNAKYSWEVLGKIDELTLYFKDFKILIGTSRKGFLGKNNSDLASQLTALIAVEKGASIIRTHNVEMASKFCNLIDSSNH